MIILITKIQQGTGTSVLVTIWQPHEVYICSKWSVFRRTPDYKFWVYQIDLIFKAIAIIFLFYQL